jgi:Uma2 family endonuclease
LSPANAPHLPVDERLVMPETRFEVIDGKVAYVPPSDEPHGNRHAKIAALLGAYVAEGWDVASDMLTRTSAKSDVAPDASVYPTARDPETGGRQLEELAFEVVSTERLGHAAKKARALVGRGVRRVFAIDVKRRRALAWSMETNAWEIMPADGVLVDRTLALGLPIRDLVEAGRADDAMAHALLAKKNPVIEEALSAAEERGEKRGEERGVLIGRVASILALLAARGLKVSKKAENRIRAEQRAATLEKWLARAVRCESVDDLLGK